MDEVVAEAMSTADEVVAETEARAASMADKVVATAASTAAHTASPVAATSAAAGGCATQVASGPSRPCPPPATAAAWLRSAARPSLPPIDIATAEVRRLPPSPCGQSLLGRRPSRSAVAPRSRGGRARSPGRRVSARKPQSRARGYPHPPARDKTSRDGLPSIALVARCGPSSAFAARRGTPSTLALATQ